MTMTAAAMKSITDILRRIPVGIRAWVYRLVAGATGLATGLVPVLHLVERDEAAITLASIATGLATLQGVLAAANTPTDFRY